MNGARPPIGDRHLSQNFHRKFTVPCPQEGNDMGKASGFMEYDREANNWVAPLERIKNFDEFKTPKPLADRQVQAARCMNCGVPFCQSGEQFGGMYSGCPLHNLIPEWNDEIYHGDMKEAYERLKKTNNFPEFTGRVCPALCEAACTCGLNGEAVTCHDNELSIIEEAFEKGYIQPAEIKIRSEKKVAVIGAGPAGLAAADQLNKRGHNVTVFERDEFPGGLLMYGIPNMKLDKKIVKRRINLMKEEGVEFKCGVNVGSKDSDVSIKSLKNEFDAIIIATGAKKARDLNVPGRDASGVYFAVDFLANATRKVVDKKSKDFVSAAGKNVVIVGGGDTGNDCVGTCIRHGCKSVTQLEMMPKMPDTRLDSNPWPQWPKVCKTDYGQQEAIAVFGHDPRIYQTTVKEMIKDKSGKLKAIKIVSLEFVKNEETGRMDMKEVKGSEKEIKCELLLIAAGFLGTEQYVLDAFDLEKDARGNVAATDSDYKTSVPGIFAAGDCRRGQSLVVWGIKEGRSCAAEVDKFLVEY